MCIPIYRVPLAVVVIFCIMLVNVQVEYVGLVLAPVSISFLAAASIQRQKRSIQARMCVNSLHETTNMHGQVSSGPRRRRRQRLAYAPSIHPDDFASRERDRRTCAPSAFLGSVHLDGHVTRELRDAITTLILARTAL